MAIVIYLLFFLYCKWCVSDTANESVILYQTKLVRILVQYWSYLPLLLCTVNYASPVPATWALWRCSRRSWYGSCPYSAASQPRRPPTARRCASNYLRSLPGLLGKKNMKKIPSNLFLIIRWHLPPPLLSNKCGTELISSIKWRYNMSTVLTTVSVIAGNNVTIVSYALLLHVSVSSLVSNNWIWIGKRILRPKYCR
jgi:hypothetical protein